MEAKKPGLRGIRLWIAALVLDAGAPLGIGAIPDPITLMLQ